MLVELVQVKQIGDNYTLSTVYVNPNQIVFMNEDMRMRQKLQEGKLIQLKT